MLASWSPLTKATLSWLKDSINWFLERGLKRLSCSIAVQKPLRTQLKLRAPRLGDLPYLCLNTPSTVALSLVLRLRGRLILTRLVSGHSRQRFIVYHIHTAFGVHAIRVKGSVVRPKPAIFYPN